MANVNYATVVGNGGYNGGQDLRFQTGLLGNDNHDWGNYTAWNCSATNKRCCK